MSGRFLIIAWISFLIFIVFVSVRESESAESIFQSYGDNYAVIGSEGNDLKIKFGFLYKPFKNYNFIHFGYIQDSRMAVQAYSSPFTEHIFRPFVVFNIFNIVDVGAEHESNGRDVNSRSLNIGFIEKTFGLPLGLDLNVRVWDYFNVADDNEDIAEYRGYGRVKLSYSNNWFTLKGEFNKGQEAGTVVLSAAIPIKVFSFNPSIYVEAIKGYDYLINYKREDDILRIGIKL